MFSMTASVTLLKKSNIGKHLPDQGLIKYYIATVDSDWRVLLFGDSS